MDDQGTVIIWEKSAKGKGHASYDKQHKTGYKRQKVKAGELSPLINWWEMLTMPAAQSSMGQGEHLPYTSGFRLPLSGLVFHKEVSASSIAPLGWRPRFALTILSNTKETISPQEKMLRLLWLFYFIVLQIFPNLAIKTVNFCFAWIQSIWVFNP